MTKKSCCIEVVLLHEDIIWVLLNHVGSWTFAWKLYVLISIHPTTREAWLSLSSAELKNFQVGFWCCYNQIWSTHWVDQEDDLENEDNLKNKDELKNEDDSKTENNLKMKASQNLKATCDKAMQF